MIERPARNTDHICDPPRFLTPVQRLVVGVGSSHGDDQAGWKVIEQLGCFPLKDVVLRRAAVPHDLIDWLEGITELHIVDGCRVSGHPATMSRFELVVGGSSSGFVDSQQEHLKHHVIDPRVILRSGGSHQLDILTVLELVESLKLLPHRVVFWTIPGNSFQPGEEMTAGCLAFIGLCVEKLAKELNGA